MPADRNDATQVEILRAPVNTLPEMLAEPQTEAVGMLMQVPGLNLRLMGLPVMFDGVITSLPHIKAGKLRPISVASLTRSPLLPDVCHTV